MAMFRGWLAAKQSRRCSKGIALQRLVDAALFKRLLAEELPKVRGYLGDRAFEAGQYDAGAKLFEEITLGDYVDFLTLPAYDRIR